MSFNEKIINNIERKYAWGFFGFVLAIILGAWSLYTEYFKDSCPKLDFFIETNTKVLDVKENIRSLDIVYNGENIKASNKNLSILKIKVYNGSKVNILNNLYDLTDPVGFKVDKAEIVEKPEIIESSNDYIKQHLKFKLDTFSKITFDPIIIEGEDYFVIKLLALHKQSETPVIKPFGKIAGIKEMRVIETYKSSNKLTFWGELTQGGFWVHFVRFWGYLLLIVIASLIVVLIIIPFALLSDKLNERKRKHNVKEYKMKHKIDEDNYFNLIFDWYLTNNLSYIVEVQKVLSHELRLKYRVKRYLRRQAADVNKEESTGEIIYNIDSRQIGPFVNQHDRIIEALYENEIVGLKEKELVVDKEFVEKLNDFVTYVKLV